MCKTILNYILWNIVELDVFRKKMTFDNLLNLKYKRFKKLKTFVMKLFISDIKIVNMFEKYSIIVLLHS